MPSAALTINDETAGCVLAGKATLANHFGERLVGLLGRRALKAGEGLVLVPCNAIHTLLMRFPLDVAFVDREFHVVHVLSDLRPNRIPPPVPGAWLAIELPAGALVKAGVAVGDTLTLTRNDDNSALVAPPARRRLIRVAASRPRRRARRLRNP